MNVVKLDRMNIGTIGGVFDCHADIIHGIPCIIGTEAEIGDILYVLKMIDEGIPSHTWTRSWHGDKIARLIGEWEKLAGKNLYW